MRFPLAHIQCWTVCSDTCQSCISEAEMNISLSLTSLITYWNNKVAAIATSCVTLWYGRDNYSCSCMGGMNYQNFSRLWTLKFSWRRAEPEGLYSLPKAKLAPVVGYLVCCFGDARLFVWLFIWLGFFWAVMWRDAYPIGLELGARLVLPTRYVFYSRSNFVVFPKCHVDFKDFFVCIPSPSFTTKK